MSGGWYGIDLFFCNDCDVPSEPLHKGNLFNKLTNLGYTPIHSQFEELNGLLSIRHCFAHEFGKITKRQASKIAQFHKDLSAGKIIDEKGDPVQVYFTINGNNIELKPAISNRLRLLSWTIIKYLGTLGLDISRAP